MKTLWLAAIAAVLAAMTPGAVSVQGGPGKGAASPPYDVAINGARIVDGSGNPWYRGTVYLRGDSIALIDVGHHSYAANKTIDGRGLVLAPGFIDVHPHLD